MTKTTTSTHHIATMQAETIEFYDPDNKISFNIDELTERQLTSTIRGKQYCFVFELNGQIYFTCAGRYSDSGRYAGFMGEIIKANKETLHQRYYHHTGTSYRNGAWQTTKELLKLFHQNTKQQGRDNEI